MSTPQGEPDQPPRSAWLTEMLAEQKVSRVGIQRGRAGDLLTQARRHVDSADRLATEDPTLALAACHDAIRKAIDAHAGALGYRIQNRPDHHRTVLEYARHQLDEVITSAEVDEADRLRLRRHKAEYGEILSGALGEPEIRRYIDAARRMVVAITGAVATV